MEATIIDPKQDKSPKIIIPSFVKTDQRALNAPSDELVQQWHDMTESKTVYRIKDIDPKAPNAKFRFKPDSCVQFFEIAENKVEYKFRVLVLKEKSDKGEWIPLKSDVTDDTPNGRPTDTFYPCKTFLEAFVAD